MARAAHIITTSPVDLHSKNNLVTKPETSKFLGKLFPVFPVRKALIHEDGLVTLSVISHGHGEEITGLLADIARCKPKKLAQIVITLNLSETRPEVPIGLDVPIHWCANPYPKGFGANHNAAFRYCDTEWFAIVNPDIRFDSDPFDPLLRHAGEVFGLVGPRVLESNGRVADAARGLITPWEIIARRLKRSSPLRYPAWMAGMFLMIRSEAYKGIGGFDERFHLYCEDFDLCARVRLLGWPIGLSDDSRVVHAARRASHDSPRHLFWHLCSLILVWTSRSWWRYRRLLRDEVPNRIGTHERSDNYFKNKSLEMSSGSRMNKARRAQKSTENPVTVYQDNGKQNSLACLQTPAENREETPTRL
jgi:N-acetylglucosaminyl-diphospho-decaprenol L-rhamnosyltransferase